MITRFRQQTTSLDVQRKLYFFPYRGNVVFVTSDNRLTQFASEKLPSDMEPRRHVELCFVLNKLVSNLYQIATQFKKTK